MTYNIQLAHFKTDHVEERGSVTKNEALTALKQFPFREELAKLTNMDEGCLPTITFIDGKNSQLAIWMNETEKYTIECNIGKHSLSLQSYTDDLDLLTQALSFFFDGNWEAICELLNYRESKLRLNPKVIFFLVYEALLAFFSFETASPVSKYGVHWTPHFLLINLFMEIPNALERFVSQFIFWNILAAFIIWILVLRKKKS